LVDGVERVPTHGTEALDQPSSIHASELPKKDQRIDATPTFARGDQYLGGVDARPDAGSKRRDNGRLCRAVRVVVLNYNGRPGLLNLVTDRGIEGDQPDVAAPRMRYRLR
jgi:hypothetical protein